MVRSRPAPEDTRPQRSRPAEAEDTDATPARTRGGHLPTGTSADRRARSATRSNGKGERTKQAIADAARRVFERDGYLEARVSDIVAEAGMAHGSFYTYFPSKREVFQEIVLEVGQEISTAVAHHPDDVRGDTLANLRRANRRYLRAYRRHERMLTLADQVATVDPLVHEFRVRGRSRHVERVANTIRRLQEHGLADRDIDVHSTAAALVAMLSSYAYWSSTTPGEYDEDRAVDTVTMIWARAIALADRPTGV